MSMQEIIENGWSLGYIPSAGDRGNMNPSPRGLLRMDNLTLDELGHLRLTLGITSASIQNFNNILQTFGTIYPDYGRVRYVYDNSGTLYQSKLNAGPPHSTTLNDFTSIGTTLSGRAAFLAALGHIFICIGSFQKKQNKDGTFSLGLPTPSPPTLGANSNPTVDLNNLDGGGNYTNWTSVTTITHNFTGTNLLFESKPTAPAPFYDAVIQTVYSVVVDTTNLGGAGNDTPDDTFSMVFQVDNPAGLFAVRISAYHEDPTSTSPTHYYYKEWDFGNADLSIPAPAPDSIYAPFAVAANTPTTVTWKRSDWIDYNFDPTKNWTNIKCLSIQVRATEDTNITINGIKVQGGKLSQITDTDIEYVVVQVADTGSFIEYSPASTAVTTSLIAGNVTITPAGAVDAAANQYWIFRKDTQTGVFLHVAHQSGAYGFTPAPYTDARPSTDLISDAAINPAYSLQIFRTALPTNVIDMIFFRDRIIYMTPDAFIPSYDLDPGSYDSRFVYTIAGASDTSETCLFIVKIDAGNFIVATTKDFYRINGTFGLETDLNTGVTVQDVNIYPLGVADPAISRAYVEQNGNIIYMSSTGPRMLSNYYSTLLTDGLDLLFRGETRYGVPNISMAPADASTISIATSGKRVYISVPFSDNKNRMLVVNMGGANQLTGETGRAWRLVDLGTKNPNHIFRDIDGTLIMGGPGVADPLYSLETAFSSLDLNFLTQYNYGQNANQRKDAMGLSLLVNTNTQTLAITVYGLDYDGTVVSANFNISTTSLLEVYIDLKGSLRPCIAYAIQGTCTTNMFQLAYFKILYEPRGILTRRALQLYTDFGKSGRKVLVSWNFYANPLGAILSSVVSRDGIDEVAQTFTGGDRPQVFQWNNPTTPPSPAVNWQHEITSNQIFEWYNFEDPNIVQQMPNTLNYVIRPYTNFGKDAPKKVANWPFKINTLGNTVTVKVSIDGTPQTVQTFNNNFIETLYWQNAVDAIGTDWQMEIYCTDPTKTFEFYGFDNPSILQVFPSPQIMSQIGPIDLKAKGLVTAFRVRIYTGFATLNYDVYDGDTLVTNGSINTTPSKDLVYTQVLPKGIDPAVLRIMFFSGASTLPFYLFSTEVRLTQTGRDTEETFVKIGAP